MDGEDEAVAEGVVVVAGVLGLEQSRVCESVDVDALAACGNEKAIPAVGGCPECESFDHFVGDITIGDHLSGNLAVVFVFEDNAEEVAGGLRGAEKVGFGARGFLVSVAVLVALLHVGAERRQFDVGLGCEVFEGLAEVHGVVLLDEREDVAAGTAGEAMEDLLGGNDAHGGFVVVVKGTEADKLATPGLEGDVRADNPHDVGGIADAITVISLRCG